ncbi:hypothetical protein GW17_00005153 [Ensete ventricosum]|nr:hypothetical protein GW17_00005153 [Ensete ventricosum]
MLTSWADSVANAESSAFVTGVTVSISNTGNTNATAAAVIAALRPGRAACVPPHLRNGVHSSELPAPAPVDGPSAAKLPSGPRAPSGGNQCGGGSTRDAGRPRFAGGRGGGGGWGLRCVGWDRRKREVNPFADDEETTVVAFDGLENTGINFNAYEDIPVEVSGENATLPVSTFAEIDLGDVVNENIRRCKYVKPTAGQRHAIPIMLTGRDLMACAQTGTGKAAAFCFPIISGIIKGPPSQWQGGPRTLYPPALILSPTRELSVQFERISLRRSSSSGWYQCFIPVSGDTGSVLGGFQLFLGMLSVCLSVPYRAGFDTPVMTEIENLGCNMIELE